MDRDSDDPSVGVVARCSNVGLDPALSAWLLMCCVEIYTAALPKQALSVVSSELHALLKNGYVATAATPRAHETTMRAQATWYATEFRVNLKSGKTEKMLPRTASMVPDISHQKLASKLDPTALSAGFVPYDFAKPMHVGMTVVVRKERRTVLDATFS